MCVCASMYAYRCVCMCGAVRQFHVQLCAHRLHSAIFRLMFFQLTKITQHDFASTFSSFAPPVSLPITHFSQHHMLFTYSVFCLLSFTRCSNLNLFFIPLQFGSVLFLFWCFCSFSLSIHSFYKWNSLHTYIQMCVNGSVRRVCVSVLVVHVCASGG